MRDTGLFKAPKIPPTSSKTATLNLCGCQLLSDMAVSIKILDISVLTFDAMRDLNERHAWFDSIFSRHSLSQFYMVSPQPTHRELNIYPVCCDVSLRSIFFVGGGSCAG